MSKRLNGGGVVGEELDDRAAKRRKFPIDDANPVTKETAETTTEHGLELLRSLRKSQDKTGRPIATHFLTLPSKKQFPDYYQITKLPIALDTIEAKLNNRDFPNLTKLESYFKRMVNNAKEYNQKGSIVAEDAERLRKAVSNYMTRHNPAYKNIPGYAPTPTPLRGESGWEEEDAEIEEEVKLSRPRGRPPKTPQVVAQGSSATPAAADSKHSAVGYQGLTFQQAQEKVVDDLIRKKEFEEDTFAHFHPFVILPSKKDYPDYYESIHHPVALKDLQKSVKGVKGKAAATGISDFRTWAAFEEEVSYIWTNCYKYNEDGSDFYKLATEFKKLFYGILEEAKTVVHEPSGTKIKLNVSVPTKITLKLPGSRASPAPSPAPQAAPQAAVAAQANGSNVTIRRNPFGTSSATPGPSIDTLERARSVSGSVASPTTSNSAAVKHEDARNSPAVSSAHNGIRAPSQAVSTPGLSGVGMAPPATPGLSSVYSQSGYAQSFDHRPQYAVTPNPVFDSKWRFPGKDASDALITNLHISTHPGLNLTQHFHYNVCPSATLAQQSVTLNLPSSHYYLQLKPTVAPSLFENKRQHRLFVTNGNQRLQAMPVGGQPVDQRYPVFDVRINPGAVNKIDIELIAALPKGNGKNPHGQEVELEKITIYANLLK